MCVGDRRGEALQGKQKQRPGITFDIIPSPIYFMRVSVSARCARFLHHGVGRVDSNEKCPYEGGNEKIYFNLRQNYQQVR